MEKLGQSLFLGAATCGFVSKYGTTQLWWFIINFVITSTVRIGLSQYCTLNSWWFVINFVTRIAVLEGLYLHILRLIHVILLIAYPTHAIISHYMSHYMSHYIPFSPHKDGCLKPHLCFGSRASETANCSCQDFADFCRMLCHRPGQWMLLQTGHRTHTVIQIKARARLHVTKENCYVASKKGFDLKKHLATYFEYLSSGKIPLVKPQDTPVPLQPVPPAVSDLNWLAAPLADCQYPQLHFRKSHMKSQTVTTFWCQTVNLFPFWVWYPCFFFRF